MEHGAVALARAAENICAFLDQQGARAAQAEAAEQGATDHAGADDRDIIGHGGVIALPVLAVERAQEKGRRPKPAPRDLTLDTLFCRADRSFLGGDGRLAALDGFFGQRWTLEARALESKPDHCHDYDHDYDQIADLLVRRLDTHIDQDCAADNRKSSDQLRPPTKTERALLGPCAIDLSIEAVAADH